MQRVTASILTTFCALFPSAGGGAQCGSSNYRCDHTTLKKGNIDASRSNRRRSIQEAECIDL
jgi:hypothetical protein